ncbi:NAD-dependent epimerase/dehydratase family protein [Methanospirillum purgamenti]|uniref:NAD-dependent epimerase/dehydratase family protein n=1 Tax=Methanospirillum hungatei TaxID=2203 RepID=A0A8F5VL79_METHU|nr:NAD-dependent epimerase/dehydratase family protein [Methanospirillum hungatei]QXO93532.1 NAD-dependent epimerase/dehydratase family protein [Methanospirillum hungatei]
MKAFVTGGAGFIGSHLVDHLIKIGSVTVFDNLSSGRESFIHHHHKNNNFALIKGDLLDKDLLIRSIENHDIVFHLAANPDARLGNIDTSLDLHQETIVTYNVLEAMRVNNINKIVFSSSGTIYGEVPVKPIHEDFGPVLPISLYGAGKLASEGLISAFCNTFGLQGWIYRFANVVGDRGTHGVIFDFINKLKKNPLELEILGDGTQEKPYLEVNDCIEGILFGLFNSKDRVNVFNLGCDSSTSVQKIARMVLEEMKLTNTKCKYTGSDRGWPGDVPQYRCDCLKINTLGWKAKYTSDEAVHLTIKALIKELGAV